MMAPAVLSGGAMGDRKTEPTARGSERILWFGRGVRSAFSVPGLILASAFVGFAGLARDAGLTLAQTVFMTGVIWALPGKVVLVSSIIAGNGLLSTAIAVGLSSVRLGPMVVALMPELRGPRTPAWALYALSHFVAVTSWVLAMEQLRCVPQPMRTSYYAGLGGMLVAGNMAVVAVVFLVAARLPSELSAALFFLTPMYFLTSLWGSARERAGHAAMVFGLVLGPVFHVLVPELDLLATGLVAGSAAFALHIALKRSGRA